MVDVTSAAPNGLACTAQMATGSFTSDGNAVSIQAGFNPRHVKVWDETDTLIWEKVQGDLPANTWKYAAGGISLDTASAIQFPADVGLHEPGSSVLLSAALVGTGKAISWVAYG